MEPAAGRSPHLVAAGAILGILGALWSAIGAVLLVLSWLYANPASLPDWLAADPLSGESATALAPVGALALAGGLGQLAAGIAMPRGSARWALVVGVVLAATGAGVSAVWLFNGLSQGRPSHVLLPALVAYLYVAWALAVRADW